MAGATKIIGKSYKDVHGEDDDVLIVSFLVEDPPRHGDAAPAPDTMGVPDSARVFVAVKPDGTEHTDLQVHGIVKTNYVG